MKVVHFTNILIDGAGKAAYRLHKALLSQGVESLMITSRGDPSDNTVIGVYANYLLKAPIESNKGFFKKWVSYISYVVKKARWKFKAGKWNSSTLFNFNIPFISINNIRKYLEDVDLICLYSIQGILSPKLIRDVYSISQAPIVWTPLDNEPMTGGCHFNNGCLRYAESCGKCPQLGGAKLSDISRHLWEQKKKYLRNIPITFVAASSWAFNFIKKSSLFSSYRTDKILLSVDQNIFGRVDKKIARSILQLPEDKKIILFGCFDLNNKRKGGDKLLLALKKLHERLKNTSGSAPDSVMLLTIGGQQGFNPVNIPFKWVHFGEVRDDRVLSLVYQASDVFASPSIDDFGPMMVNEAFMCATPVVAFNVGVAPDLIKSKADGYLANNFCTGDFSEGLYQCLFENERSENDLSRVLRQDSEAASQAKHYIKLFNELLSNGG